MKELKKGDIVISPITTAVFKKNKKYVVQSVEIVGKLTGFTVVNDEGWTSHCILTECAHLKGLDWIIKG